MKNLSYKKVKKIEIDITKRLLKYINNSINIEEVLEEIDFMAPYLHEESNRLAFNIWLSIDYVDDNGKTFIERFIDENFLSLSQIEIQILEEKSNSHVSIFQVLGYEDKYIYIKDIFNNKEYKLEEPYLQNTIYEGEFLFTRIGKVLDIYSFIGDINYVPSSKKSIFLEKILKEFNKIRKEDNLLTIREYLKGYSLNIYQIYNEYILDDINIENDIHSDLFDELEEFESYLLSKNKGFSIQKHLSNLVNIFEYYLVDESITLQDLDQISIKDFFLDAMEDKFINSQDELNSYISTLKLYLSFLSNIDNRFKRAFLEVLNISENRFYYMNQLSFNNSFDIDSNLVNIIDFSLNDDALNLVMDFENFVLFIGEHPLELTAKNKYIKRKYLLEINDLLICEEAPGNLAPNQKNFPLIHLFYHVSLSLGISEINKNYLNLSDKSINFLKLSDEEKYYLLFNYLWSKDFLNHILPEFNVEHWESKKTEIIKFFSDLQPNRKHEFNYLYPGLDKLPVPYQKYFRYFGLARYGFNKKVTIQLSNLGKKIFNYLYLKKENNSFKVINLNDYKGIN